jgi:uncharacterized protein YbjT (DUF2867 family)
LLIERIHVVAATGRIGLALCRTLADDHRPFVPVVRNRAKWRKTGLSAACLEADLEDPSSLQRALDGASHVVSTAHARFSGCIATAAPQARFVLLGSTRRYSAIAEAHGEGVREGERAWLASGRNGVILHPTMIYGGPDDDTVQRLAKLLRRSRLLPLPAGGRSLVQPIHRSDVISAILAALAYPWVGAHAMVIAGPKPLAYADFARAIAKQAGYPRPIVLPFPLTAMLALAGCAALLPGWPKVNRNELRRLCENKDFAITDMIDTLGIRPISFSEGLAREFGRLQNETHTIAQESAQPCP